ncbi:MAG: carboxylating nicotinate-nucleotide diphosphorylase [Desulfovibrio sp.]|nr:carboxylating nicotinate-nucleotide diphosphorylase [Desulfovibrio sp.]
MRKTWSEYFSQKALDCIKSNIDLALYEDGNDMTAEGIFDPTTPLSAIIRAKEQSFIVGLPLLTMVMDRLPCTYTCETLVEEGSLVAPMTHVAKITAPAIHLLRAERPMLNYLCHLSGIANLTHTYVEQLQGTPVKLLDTRKTTPGLRHLEKYAVYRGGGENHRMDLSQMLMLKDNHIDAVGSIQAAVQKLRQTYPQCPPIEVECRTLDHVDQALRAQVDRIMLDNMDPSLIQKALAIIPQSIEVEVSGGVTLDTIRMIAEIGPRHADFISVGRLTHSAKAADLSMMLS